MKRDLPLKEHVTLNTLLEIAQRRYPGYKSYTQTFVNGTMVCINKNSLIRAAIKVKHNRQQQTTTLFVYEHFTALGGFTGAMFWGKAAFRSFFAEVLEVYYAELMRL